MVALGRCAAGYVLLPRAKQGRVSVCSLAWPITLHPTSASTHTPLVCFFPEALLCSSGGVQPMDRRSPFWPLNSTHLFYSHEHLTTYSQINYNNLVWITSSSSDRGLMISNRWVIHFFFTNVNWTEDNFHLQATCFIVYRTVYIFDLHVYILLFLFLNGLKWGLFLFAVFLAMLWVYGPL